MTHARQSKADFNVGERNRAMGLSTWLIGVTRCDFDTKFDSWLRLADQGNHSAIHRPTGRCGV